MREYLYKMIVHNESELEYIIKKFDMDLMHIESFKDHIAKNGRIQLHIYTNKINSLKTTTYLSSCCLLRCESCTFDCESMKEINLRLEKLKRIL